METDLINQDWNDSIEKAVDEFIDFEKTHIVFFGNIAEILEKHKLIDRSSIKSFCDELNLNNRIRNYLYNFNYN